MPKTFVGLDIKILYPDNWSEEEDGEFGAVTLESPDGAFMTVSKLDAATDSQAAVDEVAQAMQAEYEQIEQEPYSRSLGQHELSGLTQRFVYLDLIITSHVLVVKGERQQYLVQTQAEDRELDRMASVFDAMLLSLCQSLTSTNNTPS